VGAVSRSESGSGGLSFVERFFQGGNFLRIGARRIAQFSFQSIVRRLYIVQSRLLGSVVLGADLARPFKREVLEHMCEAALAGRIVHVARIYKRRVAEDRRLRTFADQNRQAIRQHFRGDALLETLQILRKPRAGEKQGRKDRCRYRQPPRQVSLHHCSSGHGQTPPVPLQS